MFNKTIAGRRRTLLLKDNRCQQSSLWRRIDWVSLVGAEYSSSSSFSNSTPLFFWRPNTVFLWLSAVVLFLLFFLFFFFKRKAFYQFSPFNTNFERHRWFLVNLRLKFTNEPSIFVDGDLAESIKRSASDRLGDFVPLVRARTFQGFSRHLASRHLNLSSSSHVLLCRTQANSSHFKFFFVRPKC